MTINQSNLIRNLLLVLAIVICSFLLASFFALSFFITFVSVACFAYLLVKSMSYFNIPVLLSKLKKLFGFGNRVGGKSSSNDNDDSALENILRQDPREPGQTDDSALPAGITQDIVDTGVEDTEVNLHTRCGAVASTVESGNDYINNFETWKNSIPTSSFGVDFRDLFYKLAKKSYEQQGCKDYINQETGLNFKQLFTISWLAFTKLPKPESAKTTFVGNCITINANLGDEYFTEIKNNVRDIVVEQYQSTLSGNIRNAATIAKNKSLTEQLLSLSENDKIKYFEEISKIYQGRVGKNFYLSASDEILDSVFVQEATKLFEQQDEAIKLFFGFSFSNFIHLFSSLSQPSFLIPLNEANVSEIINVVASQEYKDYKKKQERLLRADVVSKRIRSQADTDSQPIAATGAKPDESASMVRQARLDHLQRLIKVVKLPDDQMTGSTELPAKEPNIADRGHTQDDIRVARLKALQPK